MTTSIAASSPHSPVLRPSLVFSFRGSVRSSVRNSAWAGSLWNFFLIAHSGWLSCNLSQCCCCTLGTFGWSSSSEELRGKGDTGNGASSFSAFFIGLLCPFPSSVSFTAAPPNSICSTGCNCFVVVVVGSSRSDGKDGVPEEVFHLLLFCQVFSVPGCVGQ